MISIPLSKIIHNTTVRNGSLFSLYSFFNSGISFILLIIIAKFINPEGYGYLNLFNTLTTILGFVVCLNTYGVISVNYFRKSKEKFKETVNSVHILTIVCSVFLMFLALFFNRIIQKWTGLSLLHQIFAILVSSFTVYNNIVLNIWRVEEKVSKYGWFSCTYALLNFILTLLFVVSLKQDWEGRIYSYIVVASIFLLLSIWALIRKGYLRNGIISKETYRDSLSYGIPLIPHNISSWLRQGLDRIFLNNFQTVDLVGLFSFSFNFANVIMIVGNAFNATNSVFIFKNLSGQDNNIKAKLQKQNTYIILFFFVFTVLIWGSAYLLIPIFFPEYNECTKYLFPQCIGAFFYCVYLQYVNYLFYYKKTKTLMYITFSLSVFHALLSFVLTRYSVMYTLWLGAFSNLAITILVYIFSQKYLNNDFSGKRQAI